ncbi:MAG: hypothetical protein JO332_06615, partial [Planctomycetaceae bacterium]|nr:hypothetical protein [Planctomycetaceae bacterium]
MIPANVKLADALDRMASLLTVAGADRFRIRAYQNAARSIAEADLDVAATTRSTGHPPPLRGIGPRISRLI